MICKCGYEMLEIDSSEFSSVYYCEKCGKALVTNEYSKNWYDHFNHEEDYK